MSILPPLSNQHEQELGASFAPRFDATGLVTAIAMDAASRQVLMVAHMNAQALEMTLATGYAHYWSRSRQALWLKGQSSGEKQKVMALFTDCDQDAILLEVTIEGQGSACHNGYRSCFYRQVTQEGGAVALRMVAQPVVSPDTLYAPSGKPDDPAA